VTESDLHLDLSVFHYKLSDYQASISVNQSNGSIVSLLQNAGAAEMNGADFDATYLFSSGLQLNAAISYLPDAKFTSFPAAAIYEPAWIANPAMPTATGVVLVNNVDLKGQRLPIAPKLTFNVGSSYTEDTSFGQIIYDVYLYHTSRYNLDLGGYYISPEHTLLNANIDLNRGDMTYSLWAKNITNATYINTFQQSGAGPIVSWGEPREIGVSVKFNY
jgi:iron complex outermembrane receptor protein